MLPPNIESKSQTSEDKLSQCIKKLEPFRGYYADTGTKVEIIIKNLQEVHYYLIHKKEGPDNQYESAVKKVEKLRKDINILLNKEENDRLLELPRSQFENDLCENLFNSQLLLTLIFPLNTKNPSTGLFIDPISLDDINNLADDNRVATTAGYIINKEDLNNYFARDNAFRIEGNLTHVLHPITRTPISNREQEYLRLHDIVIPHTDAGILLTSRLLGGGEVLIHSGSISYSALVGAALGALLGYFGGAIGIGILINTIKLISPGLFIALLATGFVNGIVRTIRRHELFFNGFMHAITSSAVITTLLTIVFSSILPFIAGYLALSPAWATSVAATWRLVEPFFPLVLLGAGFICEYFKMDATLKMFWYCFEGIILIPAAIGGIVGGLIGWACGYCSSYFSRMASSQRLNNPPPQGEEQVARLHEPAVTPALLASSARVAHNLHIDLSQAFSTQEIPRAPSLSISSPRREMNISASVQSLREEKPLGSTYTIINH